MPGTDTSSGGARRRRRRRRQLHRALSFEKKSHLDRRDANGGKATLTDEETPTEPFAGHAARLQFPAESHRTAVPAAYSSLPSSPAPRTPDLVHPLEPALHHARPLFSLWDYLREELLASDLDSQLDLKWERVSNFLSVPLKIEKVSLPSLRLACHSVHPDRPFRIHTLPRRISSYLYDPPYQIHHCHISITRQYHHLLFYCSPPFPKGRHLSCTPCYPTTCPLPPQHRYQQNLPFYKRPRYHQTLCHFQCFGGQLILE